MAQVFFAIAPANISLPNRELAMPGTVKRAIAAYREAIQRQARLPETEQWRMGAEIKRLKAIAYVEIEASQVK